MNDETIRDAAIAKATSLVKDLGPNLEETNYKQAKAAVTRLLSRSARFVGNKRLATRT